MNDQGLEEAGIDGGGLFKEFMTEFCQQAFDPENGLFVANAEQELYLNPTVVDTSGSNEHLKALEFVGKILGKAVLEGILLPPVFASFFLNSLLGNDVIFALFYTELLAD